MSSSWIRSPGPRLAERRRLLRLVFEFIDGDAPEERSLRNNRLAFEA